MQHKQEVRVRTRFRFTVLGGGETIEAVEEEGAGESSVKRRQLETFKVIINVKNVLEVEALMEELDDRYTK